MEDLKPLIGRNVMKTSEQPCAMSPESFLKHPVSEEAARAACRQYVGLGRRDVRFMRALENWWCRMRFAEAPEERLSCERMINEINRAIGMHRHELGKRLAAENVERRQKELEAEDRIAAEAKEEAEVDRWRGFRILP